MKRQLGLLALLVVVALVAAALPSLQSWAACTTGTCTPASVTGGGSCSPERFVGGGCNLPEIQSARQCVNTPLTLTRSTNDTKWGCEVDSEGHETCKWECIGGSETKDCTSCAYTGACPE